MRGPVLNTADALRSVKDGCTWFENGTKVATRSKVNLVGLTVVDDPATKTVTITGAAGSELTVRKNSGADVGTRPRLNFIEGNNVSINVTDDAGDDEVDVEIDVPDPGVDEFCELLTRRIGGITASNIGTSGGVVAYGLALSTDGTAQTAVAADSSVGQGYNGGEGVFGGWSTATTNAALAGTRSTDQICWRRHRPRVDFIVRNGVNQSISIDNCRIWLGFFSTLPTTTDNPTGHVAGFRWSTAVGGAGDSVVRVLTKDNSTLDNHASSTAFSIGRVTKFGIDMRTPGEIHYYIDDVLEHSVSVANGDPLPTDSTPLFLVIRIVNGNGGGNATLRLSSLMYQSD